MPQIANQDYNVIDFTQLPVYEARERLYRAYQQGTAFDCIIIRIGLSVQGKYMDKILSIEEIDDEDFKAVTFVYKDSIEDYLTKAPLAIHESGCLMFEQDLPIYIVSADGFKLKPVVNDGVLTGVEETTEKVENDTPAQYFKEWMIGQPVEGGGK